MLRKVDNLSPPKPNYEFNPCIIMDIVSISNTDTHVSVVVRSDRSYSQSFKVYFHLKAKIDKRRFRDGGVFPHVFDINDFTGAAVSLVGKHNLNRIMQATNSHLKGTYEEDTGVNGGF